MSETPPSPERIEWAHHHNREYNLTQVALVKRWLAKNDKKTFNEWKEQFSGKFSELIGSDPHIRDIIIDNFNAEVGSLPEEVLEEIERRLYQ